MRGQARELKIGTAMRRIAAALGAAALLLVLAAPAGAATRTPFKAHGVFASCGQGEERTTLYMTYLALRNERGFDDVKALLGHADEVRPRGMKLRVPGQDRDRELRSVGANLPDFLFIDYLETNEGPRAAARERSTISWRSKKSSGKRVRTSLRLNDLGDEFCEPGKGKSADQERMLREAAPAPESDAESTPAEPEASRGSGAAAERQSTAAVCPPGAYSGWAPDGTMLRFSLAQPTVIVHQSGYIDAHANVSGINAHANANLGDGNYLRYEVNLPDTDARGFQWSTFRTSMPASQTELGYSPAAEMSGSCVAPDRYQVTIRDRAGERTTTLSRAVLEPGEYEGTVWAHDWPREDSRMKIQFRIEPGAECEHCPGGAGAKLWLDGPNFSGTLAPGARAGRPEADTVQSYLWTSFRDPSRWIGADSCQLGFTVTRGNRLHTDGRRLRASGACVPKGAACLRCPQLKQGVSGEMRYDTDPSTPFGRLHPDSKDLSWEASRVGD